MKLELGRHTFDVTTRAVVMSSVAPGPSALGNAASLVNQGAEIIQIVDGTDQMATLELLSAELAVPVTIDPRRDLAPSDAALLFESGTGPGAQGANVAAVMAGARILVSNDVRATRRTADTVSELLQRRTTDLPGELATTGAD